MVTAQYKDLLYYIQHVGTDPSRLIFEDELTGLYNRRFLFNFFHYSVQWNSLSNNPLSLLMMDLDHLKQINDAYGHSAGDHILLYTARLLKEISGNDYMAIRYAGDELMILMPGVDKKSAVKVGETVIQRIRQEPIKLPETRIKLKISLSAGVATAPHDALTGKALIRKADTALYYAKKTGRDRLCDSDTSVAEHVFPKTALHRLSKVRIVGRKPQLASVSSAMKKLVQNQSQFQIIQGAGGMGKSEFLQLLRRKLLKTKIPQVELKGIPQEGFRPYYMASNILVELLRQQPDGGADILDELTPQEANYLSHILPQLGEPVDLSQREDEKVQREQIFAAIIRFISKLLNSKKLVLFIDDLHFCDEATLMLLRRLLLRGEYPVFVCATSITIQPEKSREDTFPLERFVAHYRQELCIELIDLTPLTPFDITQHFKGMFPRVNLPKNFETELYQLTQGNPLFLCEIQRKLVLDRKIILTRKGWIIEFLERDYLPKSLDEIVKQKLVDLDQESRKLLDQASALGEKISLSVLTGSSKNKESEVYDFIDRAMDQGLISSEYEMNDEIIRFMGKQILNITYSAIGEDRKKELHERIGNYHELLYEQHLLPSAATLAYHFQLSTNQEKTRLYQEFQQNQNRKLFNAQEAAFYTGEKAIDTVLPDTPLNPDSFFLIPAVFRTLLTAIRNIKLYPPGSRTLSIIVHQFNETINKVLKKNDRLNITIREDSSLMINGEQLDVSKFQPIAVSFVRFCKQMELKGIAFSKGLSNKELSSMLEGLGRINRELIDRRFWKRFSAEQRLLNIELRQIRYTSKMEWAEREQQSPQISPEKTQTTNVADPAPITAVDQDLGERDLGLIPRILAHFVTACSNIKLYPPESAIITEANKRLYQALKDFLAAHSSLTLGRVGDSLIINGQKIDTAEFKLTADGFTKLLESLNLKSLSFLNNLTDQEVENFIREVARDPADGFDNASWQQFSKEQKISGIMFNQRVYGIMEEKVGPALIGPTRFDSTENSPGPYNGSTQANTIFQTNNETGAVIAASPEFTEITRGTPTTIGPVQLEGAVATGIPGESMTQHLSDILIGGDKEESRDVIHQLFQDFPYQDHLIRTNIIDIFNKLVAKQILNSQPGFLQLLVDPLLSVLRKEQLPEIQNKITSLLSQVAANLILFGDYQKASRLFTHFRKYQGHSKGEDKEQAYSDQLLLAGELEPNTSKLLIEDLKSQEPLRIQQVTRLIMSMGPPCIPMLIDVIKKEDNFRIRQIASRLLKEMGSEGGELLKQELGPKNSPLERVRILEIIDGITQELSAELASSLGDVNAEVRRAAYRLAERLDNAQTVTALADFAVNENQNYAITAIRTLGKLKHSDAIQTLISLLDTIKENERLITCCRALGKLGNPAAVEPLEKILAPQGLFSVFTKRSAKLRTTAALALAQIPGPMASDALSRHLTSRDPGIRRIAQNRLSTSDAPSPKS